MNWQSNQPFVPGMPGNQFDTLGGYGGGTLGSGLYNPQQFINTSASAPLSIPGLTNPVAPGAVPMFGQAGFTPGDPVGGATPWYQDNNALGLAGMGVAAGTSLLNAFMGMKQYGLAKDSLAEGKRQFELNYGAQRDLTNAKQEDRQKARYASNPDAYESPESYMERNRIK